MIESPSDRILYILKSNGPQTTSDLAKVMKITNPGVQQKLSKLQAAELISSEDKKHGKGRPRRYWQLTEQGHARFPDRHSDLTLELLRSTREIFGEQGLEKLISYRESVTLVAYQAELSNCKSLRDKVRGLSEIRSREGYMSEWHEVGDAEFLLVENHCPICAAASICQGLCRAELEIFRVVLGPKAAVERTDHILSGARRCAYTVIET